MVRAMTGKWDHPRVCGEKAAFSSSALLGAGSPPRVRGKASALSLLVAQRGITPACAGKSIFGIATRHALKDHPRVCGEKGNQPLPLFATIGSPPRVRGKADKRSALFGGEGITPACAGKRAVIAATDAIPRDHPRVCGEKRWIRFNWTPRRGSPPRVRGKAPTADLDRQCVGRITPACAGKSTGYRTHTPHTRDHPRVCGEKTKESLKK